ncbi:MAG TPA: glycerate kinase [Candidatus Tumulicola sp.]|nr:glycerate kinase [Candidatus Tumulicola sp.]
MIPRKIVIAPDKFKGSLSGAAAAAAIAAAFAEVFPDAAIVQKPVADGGEGTAQALLASLGGREVTRSVTGPDGKPIEASFGLLGDGGVAVVELARASGIALVARGKNDPRTATTYGTGELIDAAIEAGARRVILAIGGSATNDAGSGALAALGARFLDVRGRSLAPGGAALAGLMTIETALLEERLRGIAIDIASDVSNPLCGPNGASAIYGPQKGASPAEVIELDAALARFAEIAARTTGVDMRDVPGAGAAGGVGGGFLALAGARLRPGAQLVLEVIGFDQALDGADLVVTGEGKLDRQTLAGKAPFAVAQAARAKGIRTVAVAGRVELSPDELEQTGIERAVSIVSLGVSSGEAIARAEELLRIAARQLAEGLKT